MRRAIALSVQRRIATCALAVGLALMAMMIHGESAPGLLPLVLVAASGAGRLVMRLRTRR